MQYFLEILRKAHFPPDAQIIGTVSGFQQVG